MIHQLKLRWLAYSHTENGRFLHLRVLFSIMISLLVVAAISVAFSVISVAIHRQFGVHIYAVPYEPSTQKISRGVLVVVKDYSLAPFEDLQTGDIIKTLVEKRKVSVAAATIIVEKVYDEETGEYGIAVKGFEKTSPNDPDTVYRDEGRSYFVNGSDIRQISRIKEADPESDRALFTGMPEDYGAVMESGYIGKVVFHANYIGLPFYFLCELAGWLLLVVIAMFIGSVLWLCYVRDPVLMEQYLSRRFGRR